MKSETFIFPVTFEYLLSTSSTICYLVLVHVSGQTSAQSCVFKFTGSAQCSCHCVLSSGWGLARFFCVRYHDWSYECPNLPNFSILLIIKTPDNRKMGNIATKEPVAFSCVSVDMERTRIHSRMWSISF